MAVKGKTSNTPSTSNEEVKKTAQEVPEFPGWESAELGKEYRLPSGNIIIFGDAPAYDSGQN